MHIIHPNHTQMRSIVPCSRPLLALTLLAVAAAGKGKGK